MARTTCGSMQDIDIPDKDLGKRIGGEKRLDDSNADGIRIEGDLDELYTAAQTFEDMGLSEEVKKGVYCNMRFERPSAIQAKTIPLIVTPPYKSLVAQVLLQISCFTSQHLAAVNRAIRFYQHLSALRPFSCSLLTVEAGAQQLAICTSTGFLFCYWHVCDTWPPFPWVVVHFDVHSTSAVAACERNVCRTALANHCALSLLRSACAAQGMLGDVPCLATEFSHLMSVTAINDYCPLLQYCRTGHRSFLIVKESMVTKILTMAVSDIHNVMDVCCWMLSPGNRPDCPLDFSIVLQGECGHFSVLQGQSGTGLTSQ